MTELLIAATVVLGLAGIAFAAMTVVLTHREMKQRQPSDRED